MTTDDIRVVHNEAAGRFELALDGGMGVLDYMRDGDRIIFTHTGVPRRAQGRGHGGTLAAAALDYAEANGLQVVPMCSFVASYIRERPERQHLLQARRSVGSGQE
jgi:predicted GNAT family acetyltransferase